jgi:sulfane dehydrogenase subunit SoxC
VNVGLKPRPDSSNREVVAGLIERVIFHNPVNGFCVEAALQEPLLSKAFTRCRMPWRWDGSVATLQSRAWDEAGNVQPTRAEFVASRGELKSVPPVAAVLNHHCNTVTSWTIDSSGEIKHAYA